MKRGRRPMRLILIVATFLSSSTTAEAQDLVLGQTLWGNIKTGMTKAEVKTMYPGMVVRLTNGCVAGIHLTYRRKGVETVKLERDTSSTSNSCGSVMLASLKEKYGAVHADRNETHYFDARCNGKIACALRDAVLIADSDPNTYWQVVSWFTGQMFVELYRNRETDDWHITYYQARRAKPDAASKL